MKNTIIGLGTDTLCISQSVQFRVASFRLQFLPSLNQVGSSYRETMLLWFTTNTNIQKRTLV